jgi:hypothetical protein
MLGYHFQLEVMTMSFSFSSTFIHRIGDKPHFSIVGGQRIGKSRLCERLLFDVGEPLVLKSQPQITDGKTIATRDVSHYPHPLFHVTEHPGFPTHGIYQGTLRTNEKLFETNLLKRIEKTKDSVIFVTSDGSINEIKRIALIDQEQKYLPLLQKRAAHLIVLVNSTNPNSPRAQEVVRELSDHCAPIKVIAIDLEARDLDVIPNLLTEIQSDRLSLVEEIDITFSEEVQKLPSDHWIKLQSEDMIRSEMTSFRRIDDFDELRSSFLKYHFVHDLIYNSYNVDTGELRVKLLIKEIDHIKTS